MNDFPALKIDAHDVTIQACIDQLRAMASGLEVGLDMDDVTVSYVVDVRFHRKA